jgi:MFS transporter, DHA2 family, multidrug resistance protein
MLHRAGLPDTTQRSGALEYLGTVVQAQSQTLAFQDTFMVVTGVALLALFPAFLLSRSQRRKIQLPAAPVAERPLAWPKLPK